MRLDNKFDKSGKDYDGKDEIVTTACNAKANNGLELYAKHYEFPDSRTITATDCFATNTAISSNANISQKFQKRSFLAQDRQVRVSADNPEVTDNPFSNNLDKPLAKRLDNGFVKIDQALTGILQKLKNSAN